MLQQTLDTFKTISILNFLDIIIQALLWSLPKLFSVSVKELWFIKFRYIPAYSLSPVSLCFTYTYLYHTGTGSSSPKSVLLSGVVGSSSLPLRASFHDIYKEFQIQLKRFGSKSLLKYIQIFLYFQQFLSPLNLSITYNYVTVFCFVFFIVCIDVVRLVLGHSHLPNMADTRKQRSTYLSLNMRGFVRS